MNRCDVGEAENKTGIAGIRRHHGLLRQAVPSQHAIGQRVVLMRGVRHINRRSGRHRVGGVAVRCKNPCANKDKARNSTNKNTPQFHNRVWKLNHPLPIWRAENGLVTKHSAAGWCRIQAVSFPVRTP